MKADIRTRAIDRCELATDFILKGLSYVNSGFILSPCEVRGLLGIKPTDKSHPQHLSAHLLLGALISSDNDSSHS